MRINPVATRKINFKNTLGYDDKISKMRREHIREHIYETKMPNVDTFKHEGRLEEYDLNKLIGSLLGTKPSVKTSSSPQEITPQETAPNKINSDLMRELWAYNVEPIYGTNSWKGSVSELGKQDLELLRQAGIKTIIPLAGTRFDEEYCEKHGLNCFYFHTSRNMFDNEAFKTEAQIRRKELEDAEIFGWEPNIEGALKSWNKGKTYFINKFIKFIQTMQEENVYIGCEFGTDATNNALMLNHFFNPKAQDTKTYIYRANEFYVSCLLNLIENLTPENKKALGWTKEFEEQTIAELKEYATEEDYLSGEI